MRFAYQLNQNLPKAAWCATIVKDSDIVEVEVGVAVELKPEFFVSGVWAGNFNDGNFVDADFVCCTGGKVKKCKRGGVVFSTPSHMLESIYAIKSQDKIFLSNSIAFLLERSGNDLSDDYLDYQIDMCSSLFGQEKQILSSPLKSGEQLLYFRGCNLEISKTLEIMANRKSSKYLFCNYNAYFRTVENTMKMLYDNAVSVGRKIKIGSITTISSGYDAVAASVLARSAGCNRALTFNTPEQYKADCGSDIARILGYNDIIECDACRYIYASPPVEAACMATGDVGTSIVFAAYSNYFENSMIFMGSRGDSLWERNHANINNNQDFAYGNTLQQTSHPFVEIALDHNAFFVPVPMIGADKWLEISRISQSEEMKAYSIREEYDRPIPRRIAETAGVPREIFGRVKAGAGISYHFDTFKRIIGKMSVESAHSLRNYKKRYKPSKYKMMKQSLKFYKNEFPVYMNYLFTRLHIPVRIKKRDTYISSPLSALLINWGIDCMRLKYKHK